MKPMTWFAWFIFMAVASVAPAGAQSWLVQTEIPDPYNQNMFFSHPVAVSGNTAFVSAYNETIGGQAGQGAVYVYERDGFGNWTLAQKLLANDGAAGAHFGTAVALDGERAIITARLSSPNGLQWQGSAYYFRKLSGVWISVQKIWLYDGVENDTFGNAVTMTDTDAFISSGGASTTGPGGTTVVPRAVHVFRLGPNGAFGPVFAKIQTINSPVVESSYGSFGASMSASGGIALIGARSATVAGDIGRGAVYEYTGFGRNWVAGDVITAADGGPQDNFGVSISLNGESAAIGAPGAVISGNVSQGAVYQLERSGGVWLQDQKIVAQDGGAINLFGASVSSDGTRLLVGAYAQNGYEGAAYLFANSGTGWVQDQKFTPPAKIQPIVFGYDLALDGANAVIGAYSTPIGGLSSVGAVFFLFDPCWPNPNICIAQTAGTSTVPNIRLQ